MDSTKIKCSKESNWGSIAPHQMSVYVMPCNGSFQEKSGACSKSKERVLSKHELIQVWILAHTHSSQDFKIQSS